jgi:hypothetical protein
MRSDLAEALRSKGQLQSRLKAAEAELERVKTKNKSDTRLIKDLSGERVVLITKVRDRDEELRGKAKLLDVWSSYCESKSECLQILGCTR